METGRSKRSIDQHPLNETPLATRATAASPLLEPDSVNVVDPDDQVDSVERAGHTEFKRDGFLDANLLGD
jgi:hypothetical protein